jgi:hypothetical protein
VPTGWLWRLSLNLLREYAPHVGLERFRRSYPTLSNEAIAGRRIRAAALSAVAIGVIFGTLLSAIEASAIASALSTLLSGFLTSPITIPTILVSLPLAMVTVAGEMYLITRRQLHLAYDLFILYGLPANADDPTQMAGVVGVALALSKIGVATQALDEAAPHLAYQLPDKAAHADLVQSRFQEWVVRQAAWKTLGRYFARAFIIRALIPGLSVFTAALWDYSTTVAISKTLQTRIRAQMLIRDMVDELPLACISDPERLLRALLSLALTTGGLEVNEFAFYSWLTGRLWQIAGDRDVDIIGKPLSLRWRDVVACLAGVSDEEERLTIYKALLAMAAVMGIVSGKKRGRLRQIARLYDIPFDEQALKAQAAPFQEPRPAQTCLTVVLLLFGLIVITVLACLLAAGGPAIYNIVMRAGGV